MNTCLRRGFIITNIQQIVANLRRIIISNSVISKSPSTAIIDTITNNWIRERVDSPS